MAGIAHPEFCTMYSENLRLVSHLHATYLSTIEIIILACANN